jgi:hypothetical protein
VTALGVLQRKHLHEGGSSGSRLGTGAERGAEVVGAAPDIHVSDHDAPGEHHLHFARNGEDAILWLGRCCAAGLAQVICGDPGVTVGRCQAAGGQRF